MAVLRILLALAVHTEMTSATTFRDCREEHYCLTPRDGPNYDPVNDPTKGPVLENCKCEEVDGSHFLDNKDGGKCAAQRTCSWSGGPYSDEPQVQHACHTATKDWHKKENLCIWEIGILEGKRSTGHYTACECEEWPQDRTGEGKKTGFCSTKCVGYTDYEKYDSYSDSCMSGNTGTFKVSFTEDGTYAFKRTVTVVKELKTGDKIEGLDANKQPALCTVEAIGQFGHGPLYGNYTNDHFVLDPTTGNVKQHGAVGNLTFEDKYEVMTSCPVGLDEAGNGFTPLDGDFCGKSTSEMNWSDYLLIHASVLRIVRATGGYWFSASAYKDFGSVVQHGPELCAAMLACAGAGTECDDLEKLATLFIDNYVTDDAREASLKGMPGLGKVGAPGSVSFVVSQGKACSTEHIVLITAGTVAVVAMLLVVGVVATVHHRRRKQSTPAAIELEPSNRKLDTAAPEVAVVYSSPLTQRRPSLP